MRFLLIHQNFPGQFRQLAPYLQERGHQIIAICSHKRPVEINCEVYRYIEPSRPNGTHLFGSEMWFEGLQRAVSVAKICQNLHNKGWKPDKICAHSGWGETLGLREIWPDVPQLIWPELWIMPEHGGHGLDPDKSLPSLSIKLDLLGRNSLTLAALAQANEWVMPTRHQASSLPLQYQDHRLHCIHEGIDIEIAAPKPKVHYQVRGIHIDRSVPTVTFVNRNLERLRGFDIFMRALPSLLKSNSQVRIMIVGDNLPGYAGGQQGKTCLREQLLSELSGQLDLNRIHFLGRIPHSHLMSLLQASWVHVYLSYPFVLGWSLLEAMACGCCIVGSRCMPVQEVIEHGIDGILVPINNYDLLTKRILVLLDNQRMREVLGKAARKKALQWASRSVLPQMAELVEATK